MEEEDSPPPYTPSLALSRIASLYQTSLTRSALSFHELHRLSLSNNTQEEENIDANKQQELLLRGSQTLSQLINSLCSDLSQVAEWIACSDQSPTGEELLLPLLESQHSSLQSLSQFWTLLEIFSLQSPLSRFLSFELIVWLQKETFPLQDNFNAFASLTHPERESGYWDCVYELVAQGKLTIAIEFLKLHSELRSSSSSSSTTANTSSVVSALGREQVVEFFSLLEGYPFLSFLPDPFLPLESQPSSPLAREKVRETLAQQRNLPADFANWQEKLATYRERKPTPALVLLKIPELDFLFRLLLGERRALEMKAGGGGGGNWEAVLLGELLYRYPATPLTRANLRRILEEAIQQHASHTNR